MSLLKLLFVTFALAEFSPEPALAEPLGKKQFKIGVIVVSTGPVATTGMSIQRAIQMADEQLDKEDRVKFIFEDDQFQAKLAANAAEKLISRDDVDALITFSGSTSLVVSAIAEKKKVPMVAITPLPRVSEGKSNVWTIFIPTSAQIALYGETIKRCGLKRVAIVTTSQDALLQIRDAFVGANGSVVVKDEEINPGDVNLGMVVAKIMAAKPDLVLNLTLPPQISVLSKLFREQGFKGQFLGGPPMFNPAEISTARGALTGAWLPGPKSGATEKFHADFRAQYNDTCVSECVYGYDAGKIMIQGAESGDIGGYLKNLTQFEGLAGKYPKNAANQFEVPAELKEISNDGSLSKVEDE